MSNEMSITEKGQFLVVKPGGPDPFVNAIQIAEMDWAGKHGAKSLIWDTATERARIFMRMAARAMKYANNPITFGSGPNRFVVPAMGDYGAAQSLSLDLRNMVQQQPLHTIMVGHVGRETKGKGDSVMVTAAGFALVGQALVSTYGSDFDQYIRLSANMNGQVMAQLKSHPVYGSGIRTTDTTLPKEIMIQHTREAMTDFWRMVAEKSRVPFDGSNGFLRTGIYSEPKVGKTSLVTSLPDEMLPCVYIADDPGSEYMRSTWPELLT